MGEMPPSYEAAASGARARLREAVLPERLRLLGIPFEESGRTFRFQAFGRTVRLDGTDCTIESLEGPPLLPVETVLVLRYLTHPLPVHMTDELIGFRDLPGGMFYYGPFTGRAVSPLLRAVGNDIGLLRQGLSPFQWEPYEAADFAAAIGIIGAVSLYLLYWAGDDEFEPRGEYLFDRSLQGIFNADDMAALASHVTAMIRGAVKKA